VPSSNEYYFVSQWRVKGTVVEVSDIMKDLSSLSEWWPSVYLEISELKPGDKNSIGRRMDVLTKGWLPYTIKWEFEVTESKYPYGSVIRAFGDFDGRGEWVFEQDGEYVNMNYDWRLKGEKPLFRTMSFLLKPLFKANHRWAMARGEESLKLELLRRRAGSPEEAAKIPPPPPPTFPHKSYYEKRWGRAKSQEHKDVVE